MKTTITLLLAIFVASSLQSQELPDKSVQLLRQLEQFEEEKRTALNKELVEKRKQVATLLKTHLLEQSLGSGEADAIKAAVTQLDALLPNQPFTVNSINLPKTPGNSINTQQYFEEMLGRIDVTSLCRDLLPQVQNEFIARVQVDGEVVYQAKKEGVHVIEITKSGKVNPTLFFQVDGSRQDELKVMREKMISHLREMNTDSLVVLCKAGNSHPMSSRDNEPEAVIRLIGGRTKGLQGRTPYVCFGYRGLRRGGAVEIVGDATRTMAVLSPPKD